MGSETRENASEHAPTDPSSSSDGGCCGGVNAPLCPTINLLSQTLRGASDAAFVLDDTGVVLSNNSNFDQLFGIRSSNDVARTVEAPTYLNVSSLMLFMGHGSWSDMCHSLTSAEKSCSVVMIQQDNGQTLSGSARLSKLDPCPCCSRIYYVAHVCASGTSRSEEFRQLKRTQEVVEASFDAMFAINEQGSILMVNDAAATIFGYTRDELMGSNVSIICGKKHAGHHDKYLAKYLQTGKTKIIGKKREVPARKKSGEEFQVELGIKEIQTEEDGRIFCAFIKDRTAGKFCPFCLASYCENEK